MQVLARRRRPTSATRRSWRASGCSATSSRRTCRCLTTLTATSMAGERLGQAGDDRSGQERRVPYPRWRCPVKRTPERHPPIMNARRGSRVPIRAPARNASTGALSSRRGRRRRSGLPFLEGLPERSAWAADAPPVFSFFIVGACGVVGKQVLPERDRRADDGGPRRDDRQGDQRARAARREPAVHQDINFPKGGPKSCGHAEGCASR